MIVCVTNDGVPVKDAAELVGRHVSQIYRWIGQGRLATRDGESGVEVLWRAVVRVEAEVKRGRPQGAASKSSKEKKR